MNRVVRALFVTAALLLVGAVGAQAAVVDRGTFTSYEAFPDAIINDLPCLEGTEFQASGAFEFKRGNFIAFSDGSFHFFQYETHGVTLVPLGGSGPTYVESGNTDIASFNAHMTSGVITLTSINNDNFLAIEDGHVVGSQMIRVHELERFVGIDTDGDGTPDDVKVEFSRPVLRCP
jgi:hypothetical protein